MDFSEQIQHFKDKASEITDKDFLRIFNFLGPSYHPTEILESLFKLEEKARIWQREFSLECAHVKHAEEHIVTLEQKIADLEAKLEIAVQYEINHKLRTGQFEVVK